MTGLDIARVRPVIESEIDRLIAILDMLEPDPDFEEGADLEEDNSDLEPLLGAPERQAGSWNGIESNFDDEGEVDNADDEPSLAATNSFNQLNWSKGRRDDREIDTDFEFIDEREPFGEGSGCYAGACSPITMMVSR